MTILLASPAVQHANLGQAQRALGQAQQLMGQSRFGDARQVLSGALAQARGLTGPGADRLLPITYGKLGECCFQVGDVAAAVEPTTTALRLCEEQRDVEGVLAYLGNLFEIYRYLGQAAPAGEQLGGQGRHAEAHAAFREAARLDPYDPHPRYLSGLALLHLGRPAEAVAEYEVTERLGPGWFNCRADLWLARELARDALDRELFRVLYFLEDAPAQAEEKVRTAEAALRRAPRLAPLHLFHGRGLGALGDAAAAATAYRDGLACATEPDVRSRLLVALSAASRSERERAAVLAEAASMPGGNLIAAAMATVALRTP